MFNFIFIYLLGVACVPWQEHGGQRPICRGPLSLSTMWVLMIGSKPPLPNKPSRQALHLIFWCRVSSWTWSSQIGVNKLVTGPYWSVCPCVPSAGIIGICHHHLGALLFLHHCQQPGNLKIFIYIVFVLAHECLYVYQVCASVFRRPEEGLHGEHNVFKNRWLKYFIQFISLLIIMVIKK